jgi:hypothetical protein
MRILYCIFFLFYSINLEAQLIQNLSIKYNHDNKLVEITYDVDCKKNDFYNIQPKLYINPGKIIELVKIDGDYIEITEGKSKKINLYIPNDLSINDRAFVILEVNKNLKSEQPII